MKLEIDVPDGVSIPQAIQLYLIENYDFNEMPGKKVVSDLLKNRNIWHGVVFTRLEYGELIYLRDIGNHYNVDTLYITVKAGMEAELFNLASTWDADEVDWLSEKESSDMLGMSPANRILRVWWD